MKKKSERTKKVAKLSKLFFFLSLCCFVGVVIFTVIACFSRLGGEKEQGMKIISDELQALLISTSITIVIVALLAFFIKNKIRPTVYMLALIVNGILFKEAGMYAILGVYAVDEIFSSIRKHYHNLAIINKEIDLRG